jgi:hypothetical protein
LNRLPAHVDESANGGDMRAAGVDQPLEQIAPPPLRIIALFHHACQSARGDIINEVYLNA